MKKLIMFLLVHINPNAIFSQDKIDTVHIGGLKLIFRNDTLYNQFVTGEVVDVKGPTKPDTLPSTILISHKPPSFGHSIDGYCIYQGDHCAGKHLRYWHRRWIVIGPEYTVWGCKRVNTPNK